MALSLLWGPFIALSLQWAPFMALSLLWGPFMALSLQWALFMALSLLWGPFMALSLQWAPFMALSNHCYGGSLWLYHCYGAPFGFIPSLGTLFGFFTATCTGAHTSFFDPGPKICLCSPDHTSLLRRRPYGSLTDLVPKQIIGQTLVEIYIYVIHFSRLYFHFYITTISLPFLYTQSLQQKLRVASTP